MKWNIVTETIFLRNYEVHTRNEHCQKNTWSTLQCQKTFQMIISLLILKNCNDFFMATLLRTLSKWKFHWHARLGFFLKEKDRQRKLCCYLFEKNDLTLCMTRPNGKIWHTWWVDIIYKCGGYNLSHTTNS